jgi:hypothetical protein
VLAETFGLKLRFDEDEAERIKSYCKQAARKGHD